MISFRCLNFRWVYLHANSHVNLDQLIGRGLQIMGVSAKSPCNYWARCIECMNGYLHNTLNNPRPGIETRGRDILPSVETPRLRHHKQSHIVDPFLSESHHTDAVLSRKTLKDLKFSAHTIKSAHFSSPSSNVRSEDPDRTMSESAVCSTSFSCKDLLMGSEDGDNSAQLTVPL